MKRTTITVPDDLAEAVGKYIQSRGDPPALTTVMQMALRQYLGERGFLREHRYSLSLPHSRGAEDRMGARCTTAILREQENKDINEYLSDIGSIYDDRSSNIF